MKTFVIAEVGVNHNGDAHIAHELCYQAKEAGADAVKFQMFNSQRLWGDDRIAHLSFPDNVYLSLVLECRALDIEFMCTPFGVEEVEFLTPLVKRWKIGSGCRKPDILDAVFASEKEVIISLGMANSEDYIDFYRHKGARNIILLHCVSSYPCRAEDANLLCIPSCADGYSDHTIGITAPIAAVALGATVIEKHLTLDKTQEGPDHACSLEPSEFKEMVERIREVELMLGDGEKRILPCEEELRRQWYVDDK